MFEGVTSKGVKQKCNSHAGTIKTFMPQAGFKPRSSARQLCLNIVDDLNHPASTAGYPLTFFVTNFFHDLCKFFHDFFFAKFLLFIYFLKKILLLYLYCFTGCLDRNKACSSNSSSSSSGFIFIYKSQAQVLFMLKVLPLSQSTINYVCSIFKESTFT